MKISIITTVYNLENYIEQCLTSLINQTYSNLELIIVNDCSTDKSMEIINKFEDDRIKIINHSKNMGAGQARRTGIENSTGDYVITVDGDDWIESDFIEKLVINAKETDADIISGGITYVIEESYLEIKRFLPHISEGFKKFVDYGNDKIVFLNNKLIRRTMYDVTPYSIRRYCEDTPVVLQLLYYANKVSYVDTQGYYYRQHANSLCHRVSNFEQALYKALCSQEMQSFFSTKSPEYHQLISKQEYLNYLRILKTSMTPELAKKYNSELGELMPNILNLLEIN